MQERRADLSARFEVAVNAQPYAKEDLADTIITGALLRHVEELRQDSIVAAVGVFEVLLGGYATDG